MGAAKVNKVSPYPIVTALTGTDASQGKIVKLTTVGFLIETERPLALGSQYNVAFTLPVLNHAVQAVGVVIKTYARYGGEPGKTKSHMLNEIHFKKLSEAERAAISQFLISIRQV